ncbi:Neuropeptide-Like Protein [Caenorhabditis elegans]|uniref:Neuropeptide-Like Protein n=2 Tax=Caenorhabditis elegans TaxID=6239 RepID=Q9TYN0_CAEEL|nr:Neuropeptide-Like Protein [Caenorhabditis elegans]CCD61345.1 Neuropeptide-Like Protein [Caenorhabditis elegans]|eukprot:NP_500381.1 Uncharacterized protein CELE_Y37E11B.7 [Caenorhabditis elegans]
MNILILLLLMLIGESVSLTMLGLTRGSRVGAADDDPPYFPEEDDFPRARSRVPTYEQAIGTVAGKALPARRWEELEPTHRQILGAPLRRRPLISRVLGRGGGLHN